MAHITNPPDCHGKYAVRCTYPVLPLPDMAPRTTATVPVSASRPPARIGMRPVLPGVGTTGVGGGAVWYTCTSGAGGMQGKLSTHDLELAPLSWCM